MARGRIEFRFVCGRLETALSCLWMEVVYCADSDSFGEPAVQKCFRVDVPSLSYFREPCLNKRFRLVAHFQGAVLEKRLKIQGSGAHHLMIG